MSPKDFLKRSLKDTPFAERRLKTWSLSLSLPLSIAGIIYLISIDKTVAPLGAIAGMIIGYFTGRNYKEKS